MGLLLGASVVTVFEALDLFLYNFIIKCVESADVNMEGSSKHDPKEPQKRVYENRDIFETHYSSIDDFYKIKDLEYSGQFTYSPPVDSVTDLIANAHPT